MTQHLDEPNPFTQRKFIVAAVLVAAVAVMAAVLLLTTRNSDRPEPAANDTSPATSPSTTVEPTPKRSTASAEGASACGPPAGDQSIPTAPPEATWQLVGTMAIPTRDDIGPGTTSSEGIHSCYAHSPTGAIFAGVGLMADFVAVDDTVAVLTQRALPGPERDSAIEAARQAQTEKSSEMPDGYGGEVTQQVAGFQVISAAADVVSLEVVIRSSDGTMFARPISMHWIEGDWRMDSNSVTPHQVSSLSGYIPWSGA
ncbi:hypothetical protein ET495_17270 (plasmid) [Xylanimonas allomyrinae]|uniref:DUF8175 domain-containing protein n=1 Tax=Xylanimonas allomyrinae TaxID=2509459 RepID=A0A4P6ESK9_9MICO|nr:hypothetical protein [Xylanimonas allomyrinae]QAY64973.1 hypothetical protein ET495_17270 [Xylanimonas allomyrinae]